MKAPRATRIDPFHPPPKKTKQVPPRHHQQTNQKTYRFKVGVKGWGVIQPEAWESGFQPQTPCKGGRRRSSSPELFSDLHMHALASVAPTPSCAHTCAHIVISKFKSIILRVQVLISAQKGFFVSSFYAFERVSVTHAASERLWVKVVFLTLASVVPRIPHKLPHSAQKGWMGEKRVR